MKSKVFLMWNKIQKVFKKLNSDHYHCKVSPLGAVLILNLSTQKNSNRLMLFYQVVIISDIMILKITIPFY